MYADTGAPEVFRLHHGMLCSRFVLTQAILSFHSVCTSSGNVGNSTTFTHLAFGRTCRTLGTRDAWHARRGSMIQRISRPWVCTLGVQHCSLENSSQLLHFSLDAPRSASFPPEFEPTSTTSRTKASPYKSCTKFRNQSCAGCHGQPTLLCSVFNHS